MSKDFWYPFYPAIYRSDTRHLTAEQDGIYRRLIDEYMETREPLPDNDIALARIAGVSEIKWLDAKRIIIAFFTHKNGMYFHKKCDQELDIQDKKAKRRSVSAEKAAKKRWENIKKNQIDTCDAHTERNAISMRINATDTDTDIKKNITKKRKNFKKQKGMKNESIEDVAERVLNRHGIGSEKISNRAYDETIICNSRHIRQIEG